MHRTAWWFEMYVLLYCSFFQNFKNKTQQAKTNTAHIHVAPVRYGVSVKRSCVQENKKWFNILPSQPDISSGILKNSRMLLQGPFLLTQCIEGKDKGNQLHNTVIIGWNCPCKSWNIGMRYMPFYIIFLWTKFHADLSNSEFLLVNEVTMPALPVSLFCTAYIYIYIYMIIYPTYCQLGAWEQI